MNVVVVGAGAFGGWTALELQRLGARVTLVDAWGPGHTRSSSGGDTRALRAMYGVDELYVEMVVRARILWTRAEREWGVRLFRPVGSLWMFREDDGYVRSARPVLARHGIPLVDLAPDEAARRYPQIDFTDIGSVLLEPDAGFLYARRATAVVRDQFVEAGGEYRTAEVVPGDATGGSLRSVRVNDGGRIDADAFVFACGAWLPHVFPDLLGGKIVATRQEVLFFGTPPGDVRFNDPHLPVWLDMGPPIVYGFPGGDDRGFKISDDTRGDEIDPTRVERSVRPDTIERARAYLARRFPALADAPLLETRVCHYENTADGHYIIDRHPDLANVWICGGGSGHGFKMGPAIGELMGRLVLGEGGTHPECRMARLNPGTEGERRTTQFERR